MGLSPWILFILGGVLVLFALYVFFARIVPIMDEVMAPGSPLTQWAILLITAFAIFLWSSGIRLLTRYPDPQWLFGLLGVFAFGAVAFVCRPRAIVTRTTATVTSVRNTR